MNDPAYEIKASVPPKGRCNFSSGERPACRNQGQNGWHSIFWLSHRKLLYWGIRDGQRYRTFDPRQRQG